MCVLLDIVLIAFNLYLQQTTIHLIIKCYQLQIEVIYSKYLLMGCALLCVPHSRLTGWITGYYRRELEGCPKLTTEGSVHYLREGGWVKLGEASNFFSRAAKFHPAPRHVNNERSLTYPHPLVIESTDYEKMLCREIGAPLRFSLALPLTGSARGSLV